MKVDIWMPIYIGDYIRDTQELTAEEHGAYFLLLMHYWQKDGKIGKDINRLSMVSKTTEETTSYLLENYFNLNNGNYKNKRADIEMKAAEARSNAARKNIQKRWDKQKNDTIVIPRYNDGNTIDDTESIPNEYSSSSPSSSSLKKEKEEDWSLDDLIKMIDFWNDSKYGLPKYPKSKYKTGVNIPDVQDLLKNLSFFTREQISQSIINYSKILNDNSYKAFPTYPTAISFLIKGIESYYDDAKPFDRCLKSGEIKKKKIDDKRQKNRPSHCKECEAEINEKNTKISISAMQCRECGTIYKWNGHEWVIDK